MQAVNAQISHDKCTVLPESSLLSNTKYRDVDKGLGQIYV